MVGDAYLLGGRVVTIIQPTTNGAAIPSDVFAPAYDAVAGRVAGRRPSRPSARVPARRGGPGGQMPSGASRAMAARAR